MRAQRGYHFDPDVVAVFLTLDQPVMSV